MKRYTSVLFALLAVAVSAMAAPQDKKSNIGVKAPSPYENCNCQCHHYTWQDTYGKIQVGKMFSFIFAVLQKRMCLVLEDSE